MDATAVIEAVLPVARRALRVEHLAIAPTGIVILLACDKGHAACPDCGWASRRVASRYVRNVADLPWRRVPVLLRLHVRRFFCDNPACRRKVFAEQFPEVARKWGRTTLEHETLLCRIGLACGGEAGSRLAWANAMPGSGDTILRRVRRCTPPAPAAPPRVIGIDDFAFRKGRRYGTLIVDHETGDLVDVLPERSSESTAAFLARHPQVRIVTRDRSETYAHGIRTACPGAVQIADRFHLHVNLRAAVEGLLKRHRREIAGACEAAASQTPAALPPPAAPAPPADAPPPVDAPRQTTRAGSRKSGLPPVSSRPKYQEVIALRGEGLSIRAIRARTQLNVRTIIKYLRDAGLPSRVESERSIAKRRLRISPRRLSWLMLDDSLERKPGEQNAIDQLCRECPPVREGIDLARECTNIFRQRNSGKLREWVERAGRPDVPADLRTFAKGLEREWPSIQPAMDLPWNNGRAEGHVNRIKMVKRSMYNRANFDLLRLRILARGP